MKIDIVLPNNNEQEFIKIAEALDYRGICFVYDETQFKKMSNLNLNTKIKIFSGVLISNLNSYDKFRNNADIILYKGSDRKVFERGKIDIIYSLENSEQDDFIYQRNSGFNQILSKLSNKKGILIGLSLNLLLNSKEPSKIIGRFMQNIRLCRKYRVQFFLASFAEKPMEMRSSHDLKAFGMVLGMNTAEIKEKYNYDRIILNLDKKKSEYISKGIRIVS